MIEPFAQDFSVEVAFELFVLSNALPTDLSAGQSHALTMSLNDPRKHYNLGVSVTMGRSLNQCVADLGIRPLLFGAAWKILDALIEQWSLFNIGATGRLTIAAKIAKAKQGISFSPLSATPDLLHRVLAAYINAEEYRHSIVHRQMTLDSSGAFTGVDRSGAPLVPLSVDEQNAFCRMAQWVATGVIAGNLRKRDNSRLSMDLDMLSTLTGMAKLGNPSSQPVIPVVIIVVDSTDQIDISDVRKRLLALYPSGEIDVRFRVADVGNIEYFFALDEVPDMVLTLDAANLPAWLQKLA